MMKKTIRTVFITVGSLILGIIATIALVHYSIEENKVQAITLPLGGGYQVQDGFVLNLSAQNDGNILYEHKGYVFENNELKPAETFITDEYDIPIHIGNEEITMKASFNGLKYNDKIWYDSLYNRYGGFNVYQTILENNIIIQHENDYYRTVLLDLTTGDTRILFGEPDKTGMDEELLERSALHWSEIIAYSDDGRFFFYSTNRNYFLKKQDSCQVYVYDVKENIETLIFSASSIYLVDWVEKDIPVFSITKNKEDMDSILSSYSLKTHTKELLIDTKDIGIRPSQYRNGFFIVKQNGKAVIYNYETGEKTYTSVDLKYDTLNGHLYVTNDKKYAILNYLSEKQPGSLFIDEFILVNLQTKEEKKIDYLKLGIDNIYTCHLLSDSFFLINSVDQKSGELISIILDLNDL